MPKAHRDGDSRVCGATTVVTGQSTVKVNGKLWAVEGDLNTHGGGGLIAGLGANVKINGKRVIVLGDQAMPDDLCPPIGPPHCNPKTSTASGDSASGG